VNNKLLYRTKAANKEIISRDWVLINAENIPLGRISSQIATILKGKNKPYYTPFIDCGDNVILINAEKVKLTGKKLENKEYIRYSGYPGGQKITTANRILQKKPIFLIEHAVKGMLPKGILGRKMFSKLHVYTGSNHPHSAQQPKEIKFNI